MNGYREVFKKDERSEIKTVDDGLITCMVQEWEKKRRDELEETEELLKCPEEGLHDQPEKEDISEPEPEPETTPLTLDQRFFKTVLDHVRHFVSMAGKPVWQLAALDCITCCIDLLGSTPGQLYGDKQVQIVQTLNK